MVCDCARFFRSRRDGGCSISIFESPARAVSADSSRTRLYVRNKRFRCVSVCSPHISEAGAFTFAVRRQLHEFVRLVLNYSNSTLLHSNRQHRTAPALDDSQLSVGNDVYCQPRIEHSSAKYTCWTSGLRGKAVANECTGSFLPNILLEWRAIFPRTGVKGTPVLAREAAGQSEQWS